MSCGKIARPGERSSESFSADGKLFIHLLKMGFNRFNQEKMVIEPETMDNYDRTFKTLVI